MQPQSADQMDSAPAILTHVKAGNRIFYGVVMFAAIAMFVAIGGQVGAQTVRTLIGNSPGADQVMVTALLLNIALILLIWRRTSALSDEIDVYRKAEVRAQHLAMTDPLTNLFNRRAVKEKTSELSARASRRGKSNAFMMVDLDGFKKINDLYGHDCGDFLLREVADRMRDENEQASALARQRMDELLSSLGSTLDDMKAGLAAAAAQRHS